MSRRSNATQTTKKGYRNHCSDRIDLIYQNQRGHALSSPSHP
ncbi:unnamed protein product [Amoebophrya sp. A120]|nr:unnamed protein product [Amoebophrya sp. A120]|eukprot:GSA120T00007732001.1